MRDLLQAIAVVATTSLLFIGCGDDDTRGEDTGTTTDGGTDTGAADTGGTDTGAADTGGTDTGEADTGGTDSGMEDTGMADTGMADTGMADTGMADTGMADTGMMGLTPAEISAQIQAIKESADGVIALDVEGATVTYVRPAIGDDPEGFFVQAEQTGPALFVVGTGAEVGDVVSFTATEITTAFDHQRVTMFSDLMVLSSGADVAALVQDVSAAADLVTALDDYESELVTAVVTIAAEFRGAGTGHTAAVVDTAGVMGDGGLRIRLPEALATGLSEGCELTITGPVWRFTTSTQISAFVAEDFDVESCPAVEVVSAGAGSETQATVVFSAPVDAASVDASGAQFTIPGLTVSSAAADGDRVMLTTSTQTAAESYTVTVAVTVMDTLGQPIDAAANTAMFAGFTPPSTTTIVINEIDYDQPGGDDAEFVELFNAGTTAVPLAGMELVFINGSSDVVYNTVDLSSAGTLAPGGYLLVSNSVTGPAAVPVVPLGMSRTIQNGGPDGVALVNTTSMTLVDALSYEGSITMAMILSGAVDLVSGTATSAADSNSVPGSLARIPNGARSGNDDADWSFEATPTPGAAN